MTPGGSSNLKLWWQTETWMRKIRGLNTSRNTIFFKGSASGIKGAPGSHVPGPEDRVRPEWVDGVCGDNRSSCVM